VSDVDTGDTHRHVHGGHGHAQALLQPGASRGGDRRRLLIALGLLIAFMGAEVVVGLLANSLALLSDAGHMLTDAAALGLSLFALHLASQSPRGGLTYGLKRAEILSALANGTTLLVLAALIGAESIRRLIDPPPVEGRLMLFVALAGIVVNVAATWQLARAQHRSLNIRGSYQHLLTDLYAFIGTALAAGVILFTGFERADPIASLLVAGLMTRTGIQLVRDAGRVLLEAAPQGVDVRQMVDALFEDSRVVNVHEFHVWEITSDLPALSAHVLVRPGEDCHDVRRELEHSLSERFGIEHTTLQVDHVADEPQLLNPDPPSRRTET
jgi:cobalt-zinc-cadmium efflux system protein